MFSVHSTERPSPEPAPGHLPCARMCRGHVALMVLEDKMPTPEGGQQHGRNVLSEELGPPAQMGVQIRGGKDQTRRSLERKFSCHLILLPLSAHQSDLGCITGSALCSLHRPHPVPR